MPRSFDGRRKTDKSLFLYARPRETFARIGGNARLTAEPGYGRFRLTARRSGELETSIMHNRNMPVAAFRLAGSRIATVPGASSPLRKPPLKQ